MSKVRISDEDRQLLKLLSKDINRTAYHGGIGDRAGRYLGLLDRLIDEPGWDVNFPSAKDLNEAGSKR